MLQLEDSDIRYIYGYLGKLRIECWGLNLEESSDSLWSSACWTSAINLFFQMAASGVYQNSSLNNGHVNNVMFLIKAYNYYVHFCLEEQFKNEIKEKGKYEKVVIANRNHKNWDRIRDRREKFSVINNFPKQYKKIIEDLHSHSDDEVDDKGNFLIKTLPYRSKLANIFLNCLDEQMKAAWKAMKVTSKARFRKLPREPQIKNFPTAPTGLPLDFYSKEWLNSLPLPQKRLTVDVNAVVFLPYPAKSLFPPNHKDYDYRGKWADWKFNKEFIGVVWEKYGFNETKVVVVDEEEEIEGGLIDLEKESEDEDDSKRYLDDGEWSRVYDEEDYKDYNGKSEDEEGDEEEEDETEK
ncbi:hypothetical protein O181_038617 [Austropuccinia psidii MF-1]|uniref:Uncharacterized protein n=1 Tax=Austropuccinia psidii MF-1 TaxID=1389203 RepID=A0A9Q3DF40_9BASI|nr:hypothetical protein [Austropuccinia psidii MF-1]